MNTIHTFVKQQHKFGCVIASMAMAVNKKYSEIQQLIPAHDFGKSGIIPEVACSILLELGYLTELRYSNILHSNHKRNKFGKRGLYEQISPVQIFQIDNHSVFVSHGFIYDPNAKDMSYTGFQHINERFNIDEKITDNVVSVINVFYGK